MEIAVVVAPEVLSTEFAPWVQPPTPVSPEPVPVEAILTVPLFVTVPEVTVRGPVPAPEPKVMLAVDAIVLAFVKVIVPVFETNFAPAPCASIVQLAVLRVMPPEPLYVPSILKPSTPVPAQVLVSKNVEPASVAPLSTCSPVTV